MRDTRSHVRLARFTLEGHAYGPFRLPKTSENDCLICSLESNKRRSGKFFVTGGPVLASCKTLHTRKALFCFYFRKTKSEEHIVSDLFGYSGPSAKRRMRPCCSSISNKVSIDGF